MSRDEYTGIPDYGEEPHPPNRWAKFFPGLRSARTDLGTQYVERIKYWFSLFGVAFLIVGAIAIVVPIIFSSIAVSTMLAWLLVIGGVAEVIHFITVFGAPGTTSLLLLGALHLAAGLWLMFQESIRTGSYFVWLIFGWFLIHGFLKLLLGYELRYLKLWAALSITGLISVALAIVTVVLTPTYGYRFLSVLLGADLALTGLAFLAASLTAFLSTRASASDPLMEGQA